MNLYKKLKNFFYQRRKEKFKKQIKNPRAMKEDRWLALTALAEHAEPDYAVPALLARFEHNLDNGILDTREKEQAVKSIMSYPVETALPIVKKHLKRTAHIAWPVKILLRLTDEQEVVVALYDCLDFSDVDFDRDKIDKNYDLLTHLHDFDVSTLSKNILHFLDDKDERVRFATAGILIKQNADYVAEALEKFLADDSAENTRIRQIVLDAFVNMKWSIKNKRDFKKSSAAKEVIFNNKNGKIKKIPSR